MIKREEVNERALLLIKEFFTQENSGHLYLSSQGEIRFQAVKFHQFARSKIMAMGDAAVIASAAFQILSRAGCEKINQPGGGRSIREEQLNRLLA